MPFVDLGELRTHYSLTDGNGPVLVFSNSLGTDMSLWDPQIGQVQRHFRILRYDTRGHGKSSVTTGEYTIGQLGNDVLRLLDSLHLDRVHFCGLSIGGMIGMWLGVHAQNRLHRLVLANTAAKIGTNESWNTRIASVQKSGVKAMAPAIIERWFSPKFQASSPETVSRAQKMLENAPPEGYSGLCAALREADFREAISNIRTPTLIIYGASDPSIPVSDSHFLRDRIPGAASVELDAAHLSNIEQPELFTKAVAGFLLQRPGCHNCRVE